LGGELCPFVIIFVSKILPDVGSDALVPEVAVCGTVSLFTQTILLPIGTLALFGTKFGFPWTLAPAEILMVVTPGTTEARGADPVLPPVAAFGDPVAIADTGGGFFAKLCQFGTAIAAPTAITPTMIANPCHILLPVVLTKGPSLGVVIILFPYRQY
jgi:hypothetical protein